MTWSGKAAPNDPAASAPDPRARTREVWSLGDYSQVHDHLMPAAEELVEVARVRPGQRALDVAAGTGNVAIAAARRGAEVTASDITPRMVELGRRRTSELGLEVEWQEADAQELPWPDAGFDCALSAFGAVFAPDPDRVAAELARVVRPGGFFALASWRPDGFNGEVAAAVNELRPPPADPPSPNDWGNAGLARQRLDRVAGEVTLHPRALTWRFAGVDEAVAGLLRDSGPFVALQRSLSQADQQRLRRALQEIWIRHAQPDPDGIRLEIEYLISAGRRALTA